LEARPDGRGLLLFAFGCFLFLLGRLGAEFFLMRVSLVFLLAGLVWVFWGIRRLQKLSFPLVLLATMVPLPVLVYNALAAPLQLFASDIATQVARWFGVTVHQDGNIIHLASVSLGVAEACSGLRSLSSLAVAALLLGFLYCTGLIARALLFLLSVPLSIAVNVVRVSGTALLADHNPEWALGFYHSFSGWAVFMIGFAALYAISKLAHYIFDVKRTA
jgi:exosortase